MSHSNGGSQNSNDLEFMSSDEEDDGTRTDNEDHASKHKRVKLDNFSNPESIAEANNSVNTQKIDSGKRRRKLATALNIEVSLREYKRSTICTYCFEKIDNGNILRHIEEKHKGRRFECKLCGKNYLRNEDLQKHVCQE